MASGLVLGGLIEKRAFSIRIDVCARMKFYPFPRLLRKMRRATHFGVLHLAQPRNKMVVITKDLIIKKAEHHDGLLGDLEELSLHQLNIEKIEVIGTLCKKLQILYLQNNIIQKMEGLSHLHELKYLNMALNNIVRIEGLRFVAESA